MRLFLAIDLPSKNKKELDEQLKVIKREYNHFNWTPNENYHITLFFFGEVNNVELIKKKLEQSLFEIKKFNLYSYGASLFLHNKIILYVSFRREKILESLVEKIKTQFNVNEEQKFVPHLTIARYRIPSKQQYLALKKKLNQLNIETEFPVTKIYLFQSILTGKKSVYKKIAVYSLINS